jgi:hypothetical protein
MCDQCHFVPTEFVIGGLTVQRVGSFAPEKFVPGSEGGILHRAGTSAAGSLLPNQLSGMSGNLSSGVRKNVKAQWNSE